MGATTMHNGKGVKFLPLFLVNPEVRCVGSYFVPGGLLEEGLLQQCWA